MFTRTPREKTGLEKAIDDLLDQMSVVEAESPEYAQMADQLVKLEKLKSEVNGRQKISPDTLATIIANLGGILIIVGYEQKHVVTSKALGFIRRVG